MITARKCLVLVPATILLGACASSGSAGLASKSTISNDEGYMEAVEAAAKPAGVRVVWVNPPKQRQDD